MNIDKNVALDLRDAVNAKDRLGILDDVVFGQGDVRLNIQEASVYLRKFTNKKISEDNFNHFKKICGQISGIGLEDTAYLNFTGKSLSLTAYESMRRKYEGNEKLPEEDILFLSRVHNRINIENSSTWENVLVKQGIASLVVRDVMDNKKNPLERWNWEFGDTYRDQDFVQQNCLTMRKSTTMVAPILFHNLSVSVFVLSEVQSLKLLADNIPEFTTDCAKMIKDMQTVCDQERKTLLSKRKDGVLHLNEF